MISNGNARSKIAIRAFLLSGSQFGARSKRTMNAGRQPSSLRPRTPLTPPQVRVSARWMPGPRAASMEMRVTGTAGPATQRRNPRYALNDDAPSSRLVPMRFLVRSWEYRRPRLWVRVRVACGIFNVALGVLILASVRWLGPLAWLAALPLAGAALIFWTAHRLQASAS